MEKFGLFKEVKTQDSEMLLEVYQHIDNGGFSFGYDNTGNLSIEFGFHGHSNTRILLAGIDLNGLILVLQEMRCRQEQYEIAEKLKGTW